MLKEAEETIKTALKNRPDFPQAHNTLGVIYIRRGMTDDALRHYKKAVELRPARPEYRCNLANTYARKHMLEEAAEEYKKAAELSPEAQYYTSLGKVYQQLGKTDLAREAFDKSEKLRGR
ncbi:MAG: tetratricopeptide repeat protein, partial [Candidatus Omnitrophota bacterium]